MTVFKSRADAVGDFRASMKPALARCLRLSMQKSLAAVTSVTGRVRSAAMVEAPRLGAAAAEYRIVMTLSGSGPALVLHFDWLIVQRGRSVAVLLFSPNEHPANRLDIAGRVVARMR